MSIDLSLSNIWYSWEAFRKGKRKTPEIENFSYHLEDRLLKLSDDLNSGKYKHGSYRYFWVCDSKRRKIAVASIRDRVVHRLLYDYLVKIYDKTFIFDVWSCRKNKGLVEAIQRTQNFMASYPHYFIWQADIKKFFDNVDHEVLNQILSKRIHDLRAMDLLRTIIDSYPSRILRERERERERESKVPPRNGIPIGNLTSQIFANIYLNELDRFVKHSLKPVAYLRYGDDFILVAENRIILEKMRLEVINFVNLYLKLALNSKNKIVKIKHGLSFLGVKIYSSGHNLTKRNLNRTFRRLNFKNYSSYHGLVKQHQRRKLKELDWQFLEMLDEIYQKPI